MSIPLNVFQKRGRKAPPGMDDNNNDMTNICELEEMRKLNVEDNKAIVRILCFYILLAFVLLTAVNVVQCCIHWPLDFQAI